MKCANCQSENSSASKFCAACGARLGLRCLRCNQTNDPASKYCSGCGMLLKIGAETEEPPQTARAPAADPAGERRQATVVFSDLAGYTSLAEQVDPEEVNELLGLLRQAAARVVERHGGTINQFVGDEVMLVFGIPNAEEDDPVRAIKATRELHAEIRRSTAHLPTRTGDPLIIHSGISTGLVFAQYRNDREGLYQLTGDTVNTAARLRSLASAGEVLVGPSTQRLVRPYFEMQPLAPVAVKGKSAPLVPYRVIAESQIRSRFEAARERGLQTHVGRAQELGVLRTCLSRALASEGQLVTVEGEPGIGKSRLLYEFLGGLDREGISAPQGRCQSHARDIPYFPFLDSLRRGLHLSEHDGLEQSLEKAVSNIRQIDVSLERFLPIYLHLLAIPGPYPLPPELKGETLRRTTEESLVAIITAVTKTQPMVFVIEDWHWSDAASQSALRRLLRVIASHRLMVIVSYRPGYSFDFAPAGPRTTIRLNPLSESEAEVLIRNATASAATPAGLAALICRNADGNPLFVEETCYSLLESGTISVVDGRLTLHQALDRLLLPDTVQAVIRARLDRLDENAREIAGRAAVVGRAFTQRVLTRICPSRINLNESLDALLDQEIVHQTNILPEPEYTFKHVLTREVAYDSLSLQQRKQLHEEVGRALEELYPDRIENAPILFHHYARSAEASKAVRFALLAGERAGELYANAEAGTYFNDALALADSLSASPDAERWQIDAIVGLAATGTVPRGAVPERELLERARGLADHLNDRRRLTQVLYWLGRNYYVAADLQRAIEYAQRSLEIADESGDPGLAAPPVNLMGRVYWQLSDFARSAEMMERSVEQMRVLGNRNEESTAAGFVSALFGYMGEFPKALSYSERGLKLAKELKNPYAEAASYHYRGIIRDQQGMWGEAVADYAAAQRVAEAAGDMFRIYIARFMEGRAHHMAGDIARGRKLLEDGIALATQLRTTFLLGQAKGYLAACRLAQKDLAELPALCNDAIDLAKKAGDGFTEALALRTLAEVLSGIGPAERSNEATDAVTRAIGMQEGIGAKPELGRSYATLAFILRAQGKARDADACLEKAMALFDALGMAWDRDYAATR